MALWMVNTKIESMKIDNIQKKPKIFQYLLLPVIGLLVILVCSIVQHGEAPSQGEYYYSSFLRNNYTLTAGIIFFIIGLAVGYYLNLNPWLSGLGLVLIFPVTSLAEAIMYKGSHNLIPFELAVHFLYALASIIAVFTGRFIYGLVTKGKEKMNGIATK
jgi:hypothetical protein